MTNRLHAFPRAFIYHIPKLGTTVFLHVKRHATPILSPQAAAIHAMPPFNPFAFEFNHESIEWLLFFLRTHDPVDVSDLVWAWRRDG